MRRVVPVALLLSLFAAGCANEPEPAARLVTALAIGTVGGSPFIRGRDGGASARVFGHSVWLFGDTTLERPTTDGLTWLNNSWGFSDDLDASDGIGGLYERPDAVGAPGEFLPQTDEERSFNDAHRGDNCLEAPCGARWALWPGALVEDPERQRALVFYSKIHAETGDYNFYGVGNSIAVWHSFDQVPERPLVAPGSVEPTLLFGQDEIEPGSAALVVDGLLYACATQGLGKACRLGRVGLADALQRAAWRFWAGDGRWAQDPSDATPVMSGNDIMSVSYAPFLQQYLAIYSQPMGQRVMLRTAPHPEGPWSRAIELFHCQPPVDDSWVYDAQAHAEFAQQDGRVQYVSYSRGTGFLQGEVRLVRIELAAQP